MKYRIGWMALTLVLACSMLVGPARAGGEDDGAGADQDPGAAMAESMKLMRAIIDGMAKLSGSTRLTEANVKSLLKHGKSFVEAGKDQDGEDEIEQALEAKFKKTGVYDFELLFALAPVKAWAKKAGVEPRAFVQAYMRFQAVSMRKEMLESAKEIRANAPKHLAELEKARALMGEEAYAMAKKALEGTVAMAKQMETATKTIPAVTADEKKLLAKHGAALKRVLDEDDDEDEEYDDDEDEDDR